MHDTGPKDSESYEEEMSDAKTFELTEPEYNYLRCGNGCLFGIFDAKYGTIIDKGEEERIEREYLNSALLDAKDFPLDKNDLITVSAIQKIISSLELAINANSFWEIDSYIT